MVLVEQISAMLDYIESHPELILSYCSRTSEGRTVAKRLWMECAKILNKVTPDCPNKSPDEWRTFYNEYKSKTLKKAKLQKRRVNGSGLPKIMILTPLQKRLYDILERDVGDTLRSVYITHSPQEQEILEVTPDHQPELHQSPSHQSPSYQATSYQTPSYQTPNYQMPNFQTPSSQSPTHQSPCQQPCNQATEQQDDDVPEDSHGSTQRKRKFHSELKDAQTKLERIESIKAEATLEHARATNKLADAIDRLGATSYQASNRLAAALEKIGDMLHLVASAKKKKRRYRVVETSDIESETEIEVQGQSNKLPRSIKSESEFEET